MLNRHTVVGIAAVAAAAMLAALGASAQPSSLTTGYVWDGGWCAGPFMDITATVDLTVLNFDMYFKGTLNRNVSVYYKTGSYVGFENTPGAWTLIGTVNVTPGGDGTATHVALGGVPIPAGQTFGFHVWDNLGTGGWDGGGLILDQSPTTHSNADMTLTSNNYTCDSAFESPSSGFGWEGTVYYQAQPIEPIPALGPKALAALAAILLAAGVLVLRQRSAA